MESTRDMDGKALRAGWERQEVRMVPCREVWIVFAAQLRVWCTAAGSIIADLG